MSAGVDGRRRSDAARNRALILDAARVRLETGDGLPPLKELARSAGVGVGTIYRHFPTHQSLLAELGADATRNLVAETRAAAQDADPAAGFARIVGCVLRGLTTDPAVDAALSAAGPGCAPPSGLAAELDAAVGELLQRARTAGAVSPDLDADDIRLLLLGVAASLRRAGSDDGRFERHLRVLLDGLRGSTARATGPPGGRVPDSQTAVALGPAPAS